MIPNKKLFSINILQNKFLLNNDLYIYTVSMVKITFPDGKIAEFRKGISGFEIAQGISISLAKKTTAMRINGEILDIYRQIHNDCEIKFITNDSGDSDCLELLRHDAAHILAQALKEIYRDEIQITIGPIIENGFFYDVAKTDPISLKDLEAIEAKMKEISNKNLKIEREIWNRNDAMQYFKSIGENYKAEIISDLPENQEISLYRQGDFLDLCRGPHAPSTGMTKYFKLMKIAGAYWRGDAKNPMLQRIYGTAWHSKAAMDEYLTMLEEAEKRDHRKIGAELDLFHMQDEAQGSIFWHPNGWFIYRQIENYIRQEIGVNGYLEVKTPQVIDKILWEKSGHWENFHDNIFVCETEDKTFAIKPMNCPAHIQIFNQGIKSYRDLPLRMAEFGCCHRNEPSGSLHGIMRVRSFVQDDAHIFCTKDQVQSETANFCKLLHKIYQRFGFEKVEIKLSTRPEKRIGSDETWDMAEKMLANAVSQAGYSFEILEGEGAFYGPKLEFQLKDAIGRKWQCGTLQLDPLMPERLGAKFINQAGEKETPIMLHRAILGSLERFIGILIENHAGKMPLWLAPIQIAICTITSDLDEAAEAILHEMKENGIRVIIDKDSATLNAKIRNQILKKIPIIGIFGKKEAENREITIRRFGDGESKTYKISDLIALIKQEETL